jgi:hypothetical protein
MAVIYCPEKWKFLFQNLYTCFKPCDNYFLLYYEFTKR